MEHFEDVAKQKRWNDLKAAVGHYVPRIRPDKVE